MEKNTLKYLWCTVAAFLVTSCSVYREIPEGQYLLRKVKVETDGTDVKNRLDFIDLALQVPGSRWLGLFRRWGEDPVILDTVLCESSAQLMSKALVNRGYLRAEVDRDVRYSNRKKSRYADVCYTLKPGTLYTIGEYSQLVPDTRIDSILNSSGRAQTGRIVWGAPDPKRGYTLFEGNALSDDSMKLLHPRTKVSSGVCAEECSALMKEFFAQRR